MKSFYYCIYISDLLGNLYIVTNGNEIINIEMYEDDWEKYVEKNQVIEDSNSFLSKSIIKQFDEYFNRQRQSFELPIHVKGTMFQEKVWQALQAIPYGQTWSYLDVANKIGNPKACRAVGQANRANPIPIIIPCHRVIGKNQTLTGYSGTKIDVKEKLLLLEGNHNFKPISTN